MAAFWITAGRVVVRRLVDDRLMLAVLSLTVLAAMVQLAAAPIYTASVTRGALQRILADVPAAGSTIVVEARVDPRHYGTVDGAVTGESASATASTGAAIVRRVESDSTYDLRSLDGDDSDAERSTVAVVSAPVGIEDHATLLDGRWPTPAASDGTVVTAALVAGAASAIDLVVGDEIAITDRRDDRDIVVRVVGLYEPVDPEDPFWLDDELLTDGVELSRTIRTIGPFVVDTSVLGPGGPVGAQRLVATWVVDPALDQLTLSSIDELRQPVARLPTELEQAIGQLDPAAARTTGGLEVETVLPTVLLETERSLTVTRSGVNAVVAQLALLSAMALGIGAGLVVETRRRESTLLEARGIGRRQLAAFAWLEAVVLVVPMAVAAPWVAAWLLRLLSRFGPLATIDLAVEAAITRGAVAAVAVAALVVMLVLVWPSIRPAAPIVDPVGHHRRRRVRQLTQSIGVDVALVALTAVAFWQLRTLGSTPVGGLADRFRIDPVLVVTPALGLLTGAVLTLRLVPLLARLGERAATSGRSVIGALTGWQFARRAGGQARAVFLLVMAVSLGLFAAGYAATWERAQADQADHHVGADVRLQPNRRTGHSMADLHLSATHEALDPVVSSMPVERALGQLPGSDRQGTFLLLDAAKADDAVAIRPDQAAGFGGFMDELVAARPQPPSIPLPGRPERLTITVDAVEEPLDDLPVGFRAELHVVVQGGDDRIHRLRLGTVEANAGPQVMGVDLVGLDGADATPAYPLTLLDIEFRLPAPRSATRLVTVELAELTTIAPDGESTLGPLITAEGESPSWVASARAEGSTAGLPSISVTDGEGALTLSLETASVNEFSDARILFNVRVGPWSTPPTLPAVASSAWLSESRSSVGDSLDLPPLRLDRSGVTLIGTVDAFPTVDPAASHAVIVDLPSAQLVAYEPGAPIRDADEYWLLLTDDAPVAATAAVLAEAPFESVDVTSRQLRYVELTTDPAALATIGAFFIGFAVATAFAVLVFLAVTAVAARERRDEFTLLRALGLAPHQFVRWMVAEQLAMVAVGIVLGVLVGLALSASVLPLISIGQGGEPAVPPAVPRYPLATIAIVVMAPLVALLPAVALSSRRRRQESLAIGLRDGSM